MQLHDLKWETDRHFDIIYIYIYSILDRQSNVVYDVAYEQVKSMQEKKRKSISVFWQSLHQFRNYNEFHDVADSKAACYL